MNTIPAHLRTVLHVLCFCFLCVVASASGATLTVTKTADTNDNICDADCSLREAIATAASGDQIVFSTLFDTPQTITIAGGNFVVDKTLTITGKGAHLLTIRQAGGSNRIFNINGSGVQVSLNHLTVSGGNATNARGGGINANAGVALTISECRLTGNAALLGGGLSIDSSSSVTLLNSTVAGNVATDFIFGGAGIYNEGTLSITNSTISGNVANGLNFNAAGLWTSGTVTITNSTFTDNQASGGGNPVGGIWCFSGTVTIRGTIVAGNRNNTEVPDVAGPFISAGYNLIGNVGAATGFNQPADQTGTGAAPRNPLLDPLANYGGTTETHRPQANSPAIDKGHSFGLSSDQRGSVRPSDHLAIGNAPGGDGADIGAFEIPLQVMVTKAADTNDGVCDADCSLREAINTAMPHDEIRFASPFFDTPQTITLADAAGFRDLVINKNLTITGRGAQLLTIRRNSTSTSFRIFNVNGIGVAVTLDGLTISGGDAGTANGGGINANGGVSLTLSNCHISNNTATQGNGAGLFVTADSSLTLLNSTVSENVTSGSSASSGGGIHNQGTLVVTNSTISGNVKNNTLNNGGGIWTSGTAIISNSTIADNGAFGPNSAGGIYHANGTTTVRSSIVAANRDNTNAPDVRGNYNSSGYNLIGNPGGAGGFTHPADQIGNSAVPRNPQLDGLAYYGGTTPTHRLHATSPAFDQGKSFSSSTDQRGSVRLFNDPNVLPPAGGDNTDIGAYEAGSVPPVTVLRAASRKEHGVNTFFDIDLPLTGQPGVECRSGANGHHLVFTFVNPLTSVQGASITGGIGTVADTGGGNGPREYIVDLIDVADAQEITVTLTGVTDSFGNQSGSVMATMAVLTGDTTGSRVVNASDVGQTKSQAGQPVTASNFRTDVNTSGTVNASDVGLVKSRTGSQLPGASPQAREF